MQKYRHENVVLFLPSTFFFIGIFFTTIEWKKTLIDFESAPETSFSIHFHNSYHKHTDGTE